MLSSDQAGVWVNPWLNDTETLRKYEQQGRVPSETQVFVRGLPTDISVKDVEELFQKERDLIQKFSRGRGVGPRIHIYREKLFGRIPTGECTVTFKTNRGQQNAIVRLHNTIYKGQRISVTRSFVKPYMAPEDINVRRKKLGIRGNSRNHKAPNRGRGGTGGTGRTGRGGRGSARRKARGNPGRPWAKRETDLVTSLERFSMSHANPSGNTNARGIYPDPYGSHPNNQERFRLSHANPIGHTNARGMYPDPYGSHPSNQERFRLSQPNPSGHTNARGMYPDPYGSHPSHQRANYGTMWVWPHPSSSTVPINYTHQSTGLPRNGDGIVYY